MKRHVQCFVQAAFCVAVAGLVCGGTAAADCVDDLIAAISGGDFDVRAAACRNAGPCGADAVVPLGKLSASGSPAVAHAALNALDAIVAHVGRPEAGDEGLAVASELVKLADEEYPEMTRRRALRRLALCGSREEAYAIGRYLDDPAVVDDALYALDGIPHAAAVRALTKGLLETEPEVQVQIAHVLAHKNAKSAIPSLLEAARGTDRSVGFACLAALGRLGVPPNAVLPMRPSFNREEKAVYAKALLDAAERLARDGETRKAESIYASISTFPRQPRYNCAALEGLKELGSGQFLEQALSYLTQPGVCDVAKRTLIESTIPDTNEVLCRSYKYTEPLRKAVYLQILAARKAPEAADLLKAALNDAAAEVRFTAGDIMGEPITVEDMLETAVHGSFWTRPKALDTSLATAAEKLEAGDQEAARRMYETIAASGRSAPHAVVAFQGLERIASPESLELVKRLTETGHVGDGGVPVAAAEFRSLRALAARHDGIREAAERAYVAIVAKDEDQEAAKKALLAAAEASEFSSVTGLAVEKLSAFGVSSQVLARRKGWITDWRLLGPFPNPANSAFGKSFIDEAACDGTQGATIDGKARAWVEASTDSIPAIIGLRGRLDPAENVAAYGYAEITCKEAGEAVFLMGSDDGCEFWVNGKKVHENPAPRGLVADQDRVEAPLVAGRNRILIKVLQGGVDWQFCVRVTDSSGVPLDLSE